MPTPFVTGSLWYDQAGKWVRSRLEIKGETLEYRLTAQRSQVVVTGP